MAITDWAEAERPREKLLQRGSNALTDAELLAIFLRTGTQGKTAVDLAQDLLKEFGSLQALLGADQARFCESHGLGNAKYAQLQAVLEMAKRHFVEIINRGDVLSCSEATRAYLSAQLRGYDYEVFACLFLDSQHRMIRLQELFRGTINTSSIYPREVVKEALSCNAAAVILAHNHPSGLNFPSEADQKITERLQQALALFDIQILDHFIIGDNRPYSFAENGLI
ncbi:MAG: DNA repair protein RadC [Methylococcales bacterium]|nr:DNA repair protein RadC [Methylococcales bacterium]